MKLREFIKEQHPVVCEAHLSGSRLGSSTKESGIRNCMMRTPERPSRHEPILSVQQTANAVDFRCLNCFAQRQRRKNRWDPLCDHRFTGAGRSYAKNIVPSCCGNFYGAFHMTLPFDLAEVEFLVGGVCCVPVVR